MSLEANLVEQLQELRKWQKQQQEELERRQQEQRDKLSDEQTRLFEALSQSIDEVNLDEQSLQELIEQHKQEETNLIDLEATNEECATPQKVRDFPEANGMSQEGSSCESSIIETPKVQFSAKSSKNNLKPNASYSSFIDQSNSSTGFFTEDVHSFCSNNSQRSFLFDDIPVPLPKKDFSALLEEKLKDEAVSTENQSKPLVKKPFLKKGQGLARFIPNQNTDTKPERTVRSRSTSFSSATQSNIAKASKPINLKRCNSMPKSKRNNIRNKSVSPAPRVINKSISPAPRIIRKPVSPVPSVPKISISHVPSVAQQKLNLKNVRPPQRKITNRLTPLQSKKVIIDNKKGTEIISDMNNSDLEVKTRKELEEVRIFELLEDKAENSSFCSTSSTVIAFLQQSTPLKHKALLHSAIKHQISLNNVGDETLEEIVTTTESNNLLVPKSQKNTEDKKISEWDSVTVSNLKNGKIGAGPVLPYGTDIDVNYDENSNQELNHNENNVSLHVRFSEYNEYNEYKTVSDTSSVSSESEAVLDSKDQGVWYDNSATSDSSDVESITSQAKISIKSDSKNIETLNFIKKENNDSEYDDEEIQNVYNKKENDKDNVEESEGEYMDETESKNDTIESGDTVIEKEDLKSDNMPLFKSELLKKRLLELEQEIEIFRKESAALNALKQKLLEERTNLHEERIKIQRSLKEKEATLEAEQKKTESILHEERKRLAREKAALESRMKDAYEKAQKSKQERQEIHALREQLEELREEYQQKESKWSATSARQRSQMRVLQAENSRLKQELEQLQQKQKARLRRAACPNTRAIHQINKYLADRKKISPFKSEEPVYKEEPKKSTDTADVQYEIEEEVVEEVPVETEVKKVKIPKTVESIVRQRNLYEHLLKDATEDFRDLQVGKRNLMNRTTEIQEDDDLNEDDYGGEALASHKDVPDETCTPSHESTKREKAETYPEIRDNNKAEQTKVTDNKQGIKEVRHPDGRVEYWYSNGNVKKVFPDKGITKMIYYNGDVRETDKSGTVRYFYASTRTWHTTLPDGFEVLEFPDGQVERRSKDGTIEVAFPDGSVKIVQADGSEKWALKDGTIAETSADGDKILTLPNGQKEVHTKDHKRREYPDGTIKLVYPDGVQETRYANGRVRLKDRDGNLLMDTYQ